MAEGDVPENKPTSDASGVTGTAMSILNYVDSPFKLIVVILLGILAFTGYFIHQNFNLFFNVWQKQQELPQMNEARFDEVAATTMADLKADVLVIFKVDPILNTRISERAYLREGGREAEVEGLEVGLFTNNPSNNRDVIDLIASGIPCSEYARPQSEIGMWYIRQGVTFTCRASVPPEINQFIGQITVGWKVAPTDLNYVRDILTVASRSISRK